VSTWGDFAAARPDLAEAGRDLLYQFGVGLAFLATVRPDGGPRVHPICPLLTDVGIYAFIVPSPKQGDLRLDGRYSLHSFPRPDDENAFCLTGRATVIDDGQLRSSLSDQFVSERTLFSVPPPAAGDALFEFSIERCLLTRTTGHGDPNPKHVVWSGRLNA